MFIEIARYLAAEFGLQVAFEGALSPHFPEPFGAVFQPSCGAAGDGRLIIGSRSRAEAVRAVRINVALERDPALVEFLRKSQRVGDGRDVIGARAEDKTGRRVFVYEIANSRKRRSKRKRGSSKSCSTSTS